MGLTPQDGVTFIRYTESAVLGMMAYLFLTDATVGQNAIARCASRWGAGLRGGAKPRRRTLRRALRRRAGPCAGGSR